MTEKTSVRPSWAINERTTITLRNYSQVLESLYLYPTILKSGSRVLSVGEGLSDLVPYLRSQNIASYALDPFYQLGKGIHQRDLDLLTTSSQETFGRAIEVRPEYTQNLDQLLNIVPSTLIAGSIYQAPFPTNHFDFILTNRTLEHLDFNLALPEFLRILKTNGELRIGSPMIHAIPAQNKLIPGGLRFDTMGRSLYLEPSTGFVEAIDQIDTTRHDIYIKLENHAGRSEVKSYGGGTYSVGVIVICPKFKVPEFTGTVDQIWKVFPDRKITEIEFESYWDHSYYIQRV